MEIDTGKTGLHKFRGTFFYEIMAKEKILLIQLIQLSAFYFFGESWDRYYSSLPNKFVKRKKFEKKMIFYLTGFHPYT